MTGFEFFGCHLLMAQARRETDRRMKAELSPADYAKWRKEQDAEETAERRHQEMLRAIESAGRRY